MGATYRSMAVESASLGNDPVVSVPSGTVDGDLLLAVCYTGAGGASWTAPAGWTEHPDSMGGQVPLFYRVANSEPASYTFVVSGAGTGIAQMVCVTGQAAASAIEDISGYFAGSGNAILPLVTSLGLDRLLLQMVARGANTSFTAPATATERYDQTDAPTGWTVAGGTEVVNIGSTGTRTWTPANSSSGVMGYAILIAPPDIPNEGSFSGAYDFSDSGWTGEEGPGEGSFSSDYDFSGSGWLGAQPGSAIGAFSGEYDFSGSDWTGSNEPSAAEGSITDMARTRAGAYLGIEEPDLSTYSTNDLLRDYWATRAGISGDLSTYTIADIMETYFPQFDYIKDVF